MRVTNRRSSSRFLPAVLAATCLIGLVASHAEAQDVPAPPGVAAPPSDAERSPSGLASKVLVAGRDWGGNPNERNSVMVRYTGWTTDGKMFDSSGSFPKTMRLDGLIKGWIEGLQLMVVGETRRFWIPEDLAYRGEREPFGMLVFDVELIGIR